MRFTSAAIAAFVAFASTSVLSVPLPDHSAQRVQTRGSNDLDSSLTVRDVIETLNARDTEWHGLKRRELKLPTEANGPLPLPEPMPPQPAPQASHSPGTSWAPGQAVDTPLVAPNSQHPPDPATPPTAGGKLPPMRPQPVEISGLTHPKAVSLEVNRRLKHSQEPVGGGKLAPILGHKPTLPRVEGLGRSLV
ncbi:hypothetical protein EIP91_000074 [Steccherinum ochraceum]|uniref:Uncharacterized protein n=1 Tax=Steccherinum ochraceum TaxID=92696 RepID=A0A4R0RX57_9APHY|nr:hypothetical protein EIP91_000074 [Steccherinum ochraceum]